MLLIYIIYKFVTLLSFPSLIFDNIMVMNKEHLSWWFGRQRDASADSQCIDIWWAISKYLLIIFPSVCDQTHF